MNEKQPGEVKNIMEVARRVVDKTCGNWLLTEKDISDLVVAIATEIVDDRKRHPHAHQGRFDRDCEICGEPDRDERHVYTQERLIRALEFERRVCIEIVMKIASQYLPNPAVVQSHSDAAAFNAIQQVAAEFAVRGRMYDGAGDFFELVQKARAQCAAIADVERETCKSQAETHKKNTHAALSLLGGEIAARNIGESIREIED